MILYFGLASLLAFLQEQAPDSILWTQPACWHIPGASFLLPKSNPAAALHRLADFRFQRVRFRFEFLQLLQHLLPHRFIIEGIDIDLHVIT